MCDCCHLSHLFRKAKHVTHGVGICGVAWGLTTSEIQMRYQTTLTSFDEEQILVVITYVAYAGHFVNRDTVQHRLYGGRNGGSSRLDLRVLTPARSLLIFTL